MAAAAPRTRAEYEWALYEFDQYGGKRPQAPTVTEQRAWAEAESRASTALGSTPPADPPAPAPAPTQEPIVADKKRTSARPTPPSDTGRGGSYPRNQPGLFGPTPVQPDLMTGPTASLTPPGPTAGGDIGSLYAASGNQRVATLGPRAVATTAQNYPVAIDRPGMVIRQPAGPAGPLQMVERLPDPMRLALGLDAPPLVGQGDFFGGGGTVPKAFERDPTNLGAGRFSMAPAEQAALWDQLDPRTQGLKRVLGGGMTSAIPTVSAPSPAPAAPQATPAPPPHDPRAYSNRPMTISRPAAPIGIGAVGAGNLAIGGVMKGFEMRDSLPANTDPNLADLNMADGAPIGITANTAFDTPVEVQYMRALGAERQARVAGGGRGTAPASSYLQPAPARVAPARPYVAQGQAQFGRGEGFVDPRLIRSGAAAPTVEATPLRRGMSPANMGPTQPARPVARPVARQVARPGPWAPMAVDPSILVQNPVSSTPLPVGNANIDDATRRRAYRALGILP